MRVIAGEKRGIRLASMRNTSVRPTTDSIKELIFNVLGHVLSEAVVLDMFAGTGGLGIEALSRGAVKAIFIEQDRSAQKLILQNIEKTGFTESAELYKLPVRKAIRSLNKKKLRFDLILADPPYDCDIITDTMTDIVKWQLLKQGGWLVLEHSCRFVPLEQVKPLLQTMKKRQGETEISFYRHG
jgi:16S rRNA (guanine(966)-N(2))-methyltransferase RsmD